MKSQLIEKQGKYHGESNMIMLPKKDKNAPLILGLKSNRLYDSRGRTGFGNDDSVSYQHLYFLSDEEIKDGDWFLTDIRNRVSDNNGIPIWELKQCSKVSNEWIFCTDDDGLGYNPNWSKKIIATTDSSLRHFVDDSTYNIKGEVYKRLPQPSPEFIQAFIEAYNSGKPITKVLVEYNEICHKCHNLRENKTCCSPVKEYHKNNHEYVLKLKDNQIIIKKIEERMYSELEVLGFLRKYKKHFHLEIDTEKELSFIEINLK